MSRAGRRLHRSGHLCCRLLETGQRRDAHHLDFVRKRWPRLLSEGGDTRTDNEAEHGEDANDVAQAGSSGREHRHRPPSTTTFPNLQVCSRYFSSTARVGNWAPAHYDVARVNAFLNTQVRGLDVRRARFDSASEQAAHLEVVRLFDAHAGRLRAFVVACGVSSAHVDDVVQETFLALFDHLCGGGNADNLRGWLFRVSYRLSLKHRHRKRWRDRWQMPWHHSAETVVDATSDPEERLLHREQRRSVRAVLGALPERDRQCVHLRSAGLNYREIAKVLGISLGSVAKSITRSAAKLTAVTVRSRS